MKYVREQLYEKFTEDSDPIHDMGIGIRRMIEKWLKMYGIDNYVINDDGTINAKGRVSLAGGQFSSFTKLPAYIKFNKINGSFSVPTIIESCEGFPIHIKDDLGARTNKLKSLKYFPKRIDGNCYMDGFTKEEIKKVCKVGGDIYNSEY